MIKHLEQYITNQPNTRFVLVEKRYKPFEYFIKSIETVNWDVIFADRDVIFIKNDRTKSINLITHSQSLIENSGIYHQFSKYMLTENIHLYVLIVFTEEFKEISTHFRISQFIQYYTIIESMCLQSISAIKELMKKNNNKSISYQCFEKKIVAIRMSLQYKQNKIMKSFYK